MTIKSSGVALHHKAGAGLAWTMLRDNGGELHGGTGVANGALGEYVNKRELSGVSFCNRPSSTTFQGSALFVMYACKYD
jgi:hypothetical protein